MEKHSPIIQQAIDAITAAIPDVVAIYLFGSTGTPFDHSGSDMDLAILPASPILSFALWTLSQNIAVQINKDVDLINLRDASTVFCFQILSTGKRIYCLDKKSCDEFEMIAYSSYLRLNEERQEIIAAIKKRGQIFNG